jgi:GNAT superfamily N-acetyltransferase
MTVDLRVATAADVAAIARLRAEWSSDLTDDSFADRIAEWMQSDGERRTTWLATVDRTEVGLGSLFEYRRMPKPNAPNVSWGYVANMYVRPGWRNQGIGSALLQALIDEAESRGYVRVVLSPSPQARGLYERHGFVVPDASLPDDALLVRVLGG